MAPSHKLFKFELISVALIKVVCSIYKTSFSPLIQNPSIKSSVNLVNRLESLVTNCNYCDFSMIPFTNSDEPSIMANFAFFFLVFFAKCLLTEWNMPSRASLNVLETGVHFLFEASI